MRAGTISSWMMMTLVLIGVGCGKSNMSSSQLKFDSATEIALDGVIKDGRIISIYESDAAIVSAIKSQLKYTVGQFNGRQAVADLNKTKINLIKKEKRDDGRFEISYSARLLVAWPRRDAYRKTLTLILPNAGDYQTLYAFHQKYNISECVSGQTDEIDSGILWYYYRPEAYRCPLRSETEEEKSLVSRFDMSFSISKENTQGKYPEYEKIWQDEKLIVTSIFGKYKEGGKDDDAGVRAYRELYQKLISDFGPASSSNIGDVDVNEIGNKYPYINLEFETSDGLLVIHMMLTDHIRYVSDEFRNRYNSLTKVSDFISYNGHSGLGAKIRALARMGEFQKGKYQIFFINGCDTFAYVDDSLRRAHHVVNPDASPDKYIDIITNALPAYFADNAEANIAMIKGMLRQSETYRQLLAAIPSVQKTVVTGEQDNSWPKPFEE